MEKDIKTEKPQNPFYTEKRKELWRKLEEEGKPVSKEELIERARQQKVAK